MTSVFVNRAAGLALCALLLAGCSFFTGDQASGTPQERTADLRAEIVRELVQRDDVASAEVRYRDDLTLPASAAVDVTMEPGADPEVLFDEAVRLVWESRLQPVETITVGIGDPEVPPRGVSRIVDLFDDAQREALEDEFGPRPQ